MQYAKPHLTYQEQLSLLKTRGLGCSDDDRALHVLRAVGYYRLSAYVYPLRALRDASEPQTSPFHYRSNQVCAGATFEQVESLWRFDRGLRILLLDAMETIEVGIRTRVAYVLGSHHPFGHVEREALNEVACARLMGSDGSQVEGFAAWCKRYEELRRSAAKSEDFVKHHVTKYGDPMPIWIATEVFDFGATARLFGLMRKDDQNEIGRELGIKNGNLLADILPVLNYVRNAAAHHTRLWNRTLTYKVPKIPAQVVPATLSHLASAPARDKLYPAMALAAHLVTQLDPATNWPRRCRTAIKKFPAVPDMSAHADMGFPAEWDQLPLWNYEPPKTGQG